MLLTSFTYLKGQAMNDHKKLSRARDQLYHLKVQVAAIEREQSPRNPTPELKQALHILQRVVEEAADAFMAGDKLEVIINRYTPLALPSFKPPTVLDQLNGSPPPDWED